MVVRAWFRVGMCACVYACVCVGVCVCVRTCVCLCLCSFVYDYACLNVFACACVYACVCVFVWLCMQTRVIVFLVVDVSMIRKFRLGMLCVAKISMSVCMHMLRTSVCVFWWYSVVLAYNYS